MSKTSQHASGASKSRADAAPPPTGAGPWAGAPSWNSGVSRRGWLGLAIAAALGPAAAQQAAPRAPGALRVPLVALADGLWQVEAAGGDGSADDRGRVSNALLAVDDRQGWLIGSGPSPAFGRALRARLEARWPGRRWTLVSTWAHPEAVLGAAGFGAAARVGHVEVVHQMAARCAGCIERLRLRLGAAAGDLSDGDIVRLPEQRLTGERGHLGPFDWWRVARDSRTTTTVWSHRASGVVFAPGLLWGHGAPDGRDADIAALALATAALDGLPGRPHPARWLGEQGPLRDEEAQAQAARYWQVLLTAVDAALEDGELGARAPLRLPGVAESFTRDPRHALNWQRAWRQAESRWLQRSLR
jgi:hypothetical protein